MNTKRIIIPTILLAGMMLLTMGSAAATNIDGQVYWSNGTPCTPLITSGMVEMNVSGTIYDQGTTPAVVFMIAEWYTLALNFGTQLNDGDVIRYNVSCGGETNTTASFTYNSGGIDTRFDIHLDATASSADLIVESITANCGGYLFGNQSNEICAKIKNNGSTAAPTSHVKFDLSDGHSATVSVSALNPGANETVCITDPTIRNAGVSVTIDVTADCNNEVAEGAAGELNNLTSQPETVVNNGYKGKSYTGGPNMTTWKTYDLNGSLVYSPGDSYYLSSYSYPDWIYYDATWNAGDPSVPSGATIKEARLYVTYTWAKGGVMPTYVSMAFNGNGIPLDEHYWDEKGFGTSNPYGALVYNVTADYNPSGSNTANLTNSYTGGDNASMRGMMLAVIYEYGTVRRQIFINEEFDLLYGGSSQCTTPDEATAWAPITGPAINLATVANARLITFAPGADPNEGELIFNGQVWNNEWTDNGVHQIGVSDRDVTAHLQSTDNMVGFQSSADWMEASNAFLVVEMLSGVNVEIDCDTICSDPSCRTTVNITLNGITNYGSGTIHLHFDETVVAVDSIGAGDSTSVTPNRIGAGHWKISASNSGGVSGSVVFATVTFKPTGLPSECTDLDLTVETLYDRNFNALPAITTNCSICIYESDAPFVTDPTASPAVILNDTAQMRPRVQVPVSTNTTNLSVHITDTTWVDSVYIDLTPILGAGHAVDRMTGPDGQPSGDWWIETNASYSSLTPYCLYVMAKDEHGNWNNGSCIALTVKRRGDITGSGALPDNKVDMADYNEIAMYTVGLKPLPPEFVAGTVPSDSWNGVDMADALYIAMYTTLNPIPGYPAP